MKKQFLFLMSFFTMLNLWSQALYVPNGTNGIGSSSDESIKSTVSSFIFNNNNQQNATIWITNPNTGRSNVGHYYLKAFDYWGAYLHFEGAGDNGNENLNITVDGKIGIGTNSPAAKFHLYDEQQLGSAINDSELMVRVSGRTSNTFMNNIWLRRDAQGSDWLTTRLHDAISIDVSYLSPGTNTRTWWERDPYNNIQSWGDGDQTYVTLKSGKIGIGTTSPSAKLEVDGNIVSEEVKVQVVTPPDYVFAEGYKPFTLEEIKAYISANKHLPEIPSAKEMEANGIELGKMNMLLLKKIEELTLYQIALQEELQKIKQELDQIRSNKPTK